MTLVKNKTETDNTMISSKQKKSITVDIKNVKMKNAKKWNVERMSSVKGRDSKDLDLSLK